MSKATKTKKAVSLEVFIFLAVIIAFFGLIGAKMGGVNMTTTWPNVKRCKHDADDDEHSLSVTS